MIKEIKPERILITPGEPAGIGPDITIHIAQQKWPVELVAVTDPTLLTQRAKQIGLPLRLVDSNLEHDPTPNAAGVLKILPMPMQEPVRPGELNIGNTPFVISTLETAANICLKKKAAALVTGPVHKGIINKAGIAFYGHTEFFAQLCNAPHTVMLFVIDKLRVALVTTHIPLNNVSQALTKEKLIATLTLIHESLKKYFALPSPRIFVCGLNPHAGEGGYLGREEIDTIIPVLNAMRKQDYNIEGPLPADTIFTPKYLERADVILAMYHDQGLPLVKYIGFGQAVNLTLGLPFIRTSVDHGTAIDIAGTKEADPGSMHAAIKLAIELM